MICCISAEFVGWSQWHEDARWNPNGGKVSVNCPRTNVSSYCFSLSCDGVNNQVWVKKTLTRRSDHIDGCSPFVICVCRVFFSFLLLLQSATTHRVTLVVVNFSLQGFPSDLSLDRNLKASSILRTRHFWHIAWSFPNHLYETAKALSHETWIKNLCEIIWSFPES